MEGIPMNESNLQPVRSKDEARERGRRGGIASGESRREKAKLKEMLELVMDRDHWTLDGVKMTKGMAMAVAMVDKAIDGDVAAFRAVRDTIEPVISRLEFDRPSPEAYAEVEALLGIDNNNER